jgi:hypothetical protein
MVSATHKRFYNRRLETAHSEEVRLRRRNAKFLSRMDQIVHSNIEMSNKCFLVIDFQSETYVGSIICRDRSFCAQISDLLRDHIGRSIKEIGDLDLSSIL